LNYLFVYDSRRGKSTTGKICEWISEGLIEACKDVNILGIKRAVDVTSEDVASADIIVIGSPIYMEKPMKSILSFLEKNMENLKLKNIALFIVCIRLSKGGKYLEKLRSHVKGSIILDKVFGGKFLFINRVNKSEAVNFGVKLCKRVVEEKSFIS